MVAVNNFILAKLCDKSYEGVIPERGFAVNNFQRTDEQWYVNKKYTLLNDVYGLQYFLFYQLQNEKEVNHVLAFTGSELQNGKLNAFKDFVANDFAILVENMKGSFLPTVFPQALDAMVRLQNIKVDYPRLIVTGHSLGGGVAAIIAAHLQLKAVTFNAPGVSNSCKNLAKVKLLTFQSKYLEYMEAYSQCIESTNITNINLEADVVSTRILNHNAQQFSLDSCKNQSLWTCNVKGVVKNHIMETVIEEIRKNPILATSFGLPNENIKTAGTIKNVLEDFTYNFSNPFYFQKVFGMPMLGIRVGIW
jgi:predicted esterase YcpF (UPF0227 family)